MARRNPFLLPRDVEPTHYNLTLMPDLKRWTFSGSETVSITIRRPTSRIVVHAVDLKITRVHLSFPGMDPEVITPKRISFSKRRETLTLSFGRTLRPGEAELSFEFEGELNDKMHGFYRTSYEIRGEKRWGAATQFEATDARRAFPCWDEPDRKARFSVTLIVPEPLTALSNMPPVSQAPLEAGLKRVSFEVTPPMPTYLLAFVIADLECLEAVESNGIPIRVWTTPGKKEQGRFALQVACHTLPYFSEWFGIPYALPKLDMVALPDFASGAMENWGLVTYRETALLVDPEHSSAAARQRVAEVVDHELAHQWFGNLVTMKWWTDLWLNEGYASYKGPKAVDHQFPEWEIWTQYVADDFLAALHEDSLRNTHPVEVPVKDPYEIRETFDTITYSKGSVVNRMLEHYLGEDDFRKGLHLYLTRHAYGNATTGALWQALEEASGKPVKAIMASYTRQPGYPVIIVRDAVKDGRLVLELEQRRFLLDGGRDRKNPLWKIPVGLFTSIAEKPTFVYMGGRRKRLSLEVGGGDWVKLNPGQAGFYRVAYSPELWRRLIHAVRSGMMPTIDRLGLLDDAFALARAGYMRTSMAMEVLNAYAAETNFSVWMVIARSLESLDTVLSQEDYREAFRGFARGFFRPIARAKGWEKTPSDTHLDVMLRALVLRNLGGYGETSTVEEARGRFETFMRRGGLDPDLRQVVYTLVAENGGEKEWAELLKIYDATDLHEEKVRVLRAMGAFRHEEILTEVLQFSLSERVRAQDTPIAIISVASHPLGRALAWEFVKQHWKTLLKRYHDGGLGLLTRILGITAGFHTQEKLRDVERFFRTHRVPGTGRVMRQSLELIRSNIAWLERDREDLRGWLEATSSPRP